MSDITYLSQEKLEELKQELKKRETEIRREISEKIGNAKDLGDLSENFEYQDAKDIQAENERRIVELQDMIHQAVIVEKRSGEEAIALGTTFTAELSNGTKKKFEIVGPTETDPMSGKISNESPLGQEFLGKKLGESVKISTASGEIEYKITEIE